MAFVLAAMSILVAARASSRVRRSPWGPAVFGVLGSIATAITIEYWYGAVDGAPIGRAMVAVGCAAVALNGCAAALLLLPVLRRLPMAAAAPVAASAVVVGGVSAPLLVFPVFTALLVALASLLVVRLMWRTDRPEEAAERTPLGAPEA